MTLLLYSLGIDPAKKNFAAQLATHPDHQQTGSSQNKSHLANRGDRRSRPLLFLAALSSCRHDPAIAFHYWRHKRQGLTGKQATCAVMNRLARLMWTLAKTKTSNDQKKAIQNIKHYHADLWKTFIEENQKQAVNVEMEQQGALT